VCLGILVVNPLNTAKKVWKVETAKRTAVKRQLDDRDGESSLTPKRKEYIFS
jgi:hypothetical protein